MLWAAEIMVPPRSPTPAQGDEDGQMVEGGVGGAAAGEPPPQQVTREEAGAIKSVSAQACQSFTDEWLSDEVFVDPMQCGWVQN